MCPERPDPTHACDPVSTHEPNTASSRLRKAKADRERSRSEQSVTTGKYDELLSFTEKKIKQLVELSDVDNWPACGFAIWERLPDYKHWE